MFQSYQPIGKLLIQKMNQRTIENELIFYKKTTKELPFQNQKIAIKIPVYFINQDQKSAHSKIQLPSIDCVETQRKDLDKKQNKQKEYEQFQKLLKPLNLPKKINKKIKSQFNNLLTEDEIVQYEDRQIENFQKLDLLGRGGYSLVWKVKDLKTDHNFAAKQILKQNMQSYKNEMQIMKIIQNHFTNTNDQRQKYFLNLFETKITKKDMFMIYEEGGQSLHKEIYNIQGQFINGSREYIINNKDLYNKMLSNPKILQQIIIQIAQVLTLLNELNIVHCDIKPENILINYENDQFKQIKIADFGSAYIHGIEQCSRMSTPEYLPPEMHQNKKNIQDKSHSTDVWSLGVVILEILTGIPVWMTFKCQVIQGNNNIFKQGLFYAKGRSNEKIYQKQLQFFQDIQNNIRKQWGDWEYISNSHKLLNLLENMLQQDPNLRYTPQQILAHPFLN